MQKLRTRANILLSMFGVFILGIIVLIITVASGAITADYVGFVVGVVIALILILLGLFGFWVTNIVMIIKNDNELKSDPKFKTTRIFMIIGIFMPFLALIAGFKIRSLTKTKPTQKKA